MGKKTVTAQLGSALGGIFHNWYLALAGALSLFAPGVTWPLFSFVKNSSVMKFFFSPFLGRVGAGGRGNSLAARWIHPSALSYMGTWCPSVIPCASWWFPWEELHNYCLLLNNPFFLLELGWKTSESCIRAGGRAVLSFWGYRTPDGFKNLKCILKRSIYSFLCVSGYPVAAVTSLRTEQ